MANETQSGEGKTAKAKRASCKKRELQDAKKRVANKAFRARVRTVIKEMRESVSSGDKAKQKEALNKAYSLLDKGVNNGIFKRNKASRTKARLTAYMHAKA